MEIKMIKAENITFKYGEKEIIQNTNFAIDRGDKIGIIGPNGAGKTTITKLLTGFRKDFGGKITIKGKDIRQMDRKSAARLISVVLQNVEVFFPYKVKEIVLMGRYPHIKDFSDYSKTDILKSEEVMKKMNIFDLREKEINKLSGGEKQRVFIAKALVAEPEVLILDEPTSNLDIKSQYDMFELIENIHKEKPITIILITHDMHHALRFCDKIMVVKNGCVQYFGQAEEIIKKEVISDIFDININHLSGF
jgi:iron complex transport system ATP-binding protein